MHPCAGRVQREEPFALSSFYSPFNRAGTHGIGWGARGNGSRPAVPTKPALFTGGRCRRQRPWGSSSLPPYKSQRLTRCVAAHQIGHRLQCAGLGGSRAGRRPQGNRLVGQAQRTRRSPTHTPQPEGSVCVVWEASVCRSERQHVDRPTEEQSGGACECSPGQADR